MFERMIRELQTLGRTKEISVPIQADSEGYLDKECPAEACMFSFKVHGDDWRNLVRGDEVFCPMCRHAAHGKSWFTTSQIELAKKHAVAQLQGRLNQAMRDDARAWNAQQKSGFLRITMDVRGPTRAIPVPVAAGEPMRLKATCEACSCRYSYIGSAFFCPACGHNSAAGTFEQTLAAVRTVASLRQQLRMSLSADDAELTARLLREKGLGDVVMAVQRLAERIWESLPGTRPAPRNAFQRLDDAGKLWLGATGQDFSAFLSVEEFRHLQIGYQRRHLLAHRQGEVDEEYLRKSGDRALSVGQRVTVNDEFLIDFVNLAEKLGRGMLTALQSPSDTHISLVIESATVPPQTPTEYARATPRLASGYSADADAIARLLVFSSKNGRRSDPQLSADTVRQGTGLTDDDIAEAVYALERSGLVTRYEVLAMGNIGFHLLSPEPGLFELFDPIFGLGDPTNDARALADALLEGGEQAGSTTALAERLGWTARRTNPALDWLIARDLVMASETRDPVWTTVWIRRNPGLRTFVQQGSP